MSERRKKTAAERLEQEKWELEKEKEEVAWRKKQKEEWERAQEKEKLEQELRDLKEKVSEVEKEEKVYTRLPAEKKDTREKVMEAIGVYQTRYADIRSRDEENRRQRRPTRAERGGTVKPTMAPMDRKGKVEKEVKESEYLLDIPNTRLMMRPQNCTDRRLANARRHLIVYLAGIDSDPEVADQSDDTVRASKLLRVLEDREDPASIFIESETSSGESGSESESGENSSDSSVESRVGEKRMWKQEEEDLRHNVNQPLLPHRRT